MGPTRGERRRRWIEMSKVSGTRFPGSSFSSPSSSFSLGRYRLIAGGDSRNRGGNNPNQRYHPIASGPRIGLLVDRYILPNTGDTIRYYRPWYQSRSYNSHPAFVYIPKEKKRHSGGRRRKRKEEMEEEEEEEEEEGEVVVEDEEGRRGGGRKMGRWWRKKEECEDENLEC
ncbi:hypothetical protein GW17_00038525 [Ensete ventricosum]|nr:hypothetical protein GW17_00038525 [Ensete ventricosum]